MNGVLGAFIGVPATMLVAGGLGIIGLTIYTRLIGTRRGKRPVHWGHMALGTVMFAPPHGALSIVIAGPKKTQIRGAADMAGKKIGLTRATLEEASVPPIAPAGAQMVFFDDIAATMQAMVSGQVDAAGMSAFAAKSVSDRNPKATIENKFTVRTAYYAAAVRPGDFDLLQFLRTWVFLNKHNGVLANIYKKYTEVALVELPAM